MITKAFPCNLTSAALYCLEENGNASMLHFGMYKTNPLSTLCASAQQMSAEILVYQIGLVELAGLLLNT